MAVCFFFLEGAHDGQLENLDLTLDWTGLDSGLDIFFRGVIFFWGGGGWGGCIIFCSL